MKPAAKLICFCSFALAAIAQGPGGVNPDSQILSDFSHRVNDYVKIHKAAQSEIHRPKPTNSSEAIEHYEHHLAHRIREARRGTLEGNVFTPAIAAEFRRLLGIAMQGSEAARIRRSLQSAAPVRIHLLRVDSEYPAGVPLQSMPPSLLLNLPSLPPEVEYRIVGRDLVLRDIEANLVVDFIPNAIP
jgi:hypothetical protein